MARREGSGDAGRSPAVIVGRRDELGRLNARLRRVRQGEALQIVWVHGPGGIGKTTLLRELARSAAASGLRAALVSPGPSDVSPGAILDLAARALRRRRTPERIAALFERAPVVLLVDGLESAAHLESWLVEGALDTAASGLLVIASRDAPSHGWRASQLRARFESIELQNLDAAACERYLASEGVARASHPTVVEVTRGHPLALVLFAEVARSAPAGELDPGATRDVLRSLLDALLERTLDAPQRAALEAAATVKHVTVPLLQAMVAPADAYALFRWLQRRPYVRADAQGLVLHDLIRDAVLADVRWRDPDLHASYAERALDHLCASFEGARLHRQQQIAAEIVYAMGRESGYTSFFLQAPDLQLDEPRERDFPAILAMIEQHEGIDSRRTCERWLRVAPQSTTVARDGSREVVGLWMDLELDRVRAEDLDADPITRKIAASLRRDPTLTGAPVVVQRFVADRVAYRGIGPSTPLNAPAELRALFRRRGLALRLLVAPETTPWTAMWESVHYRRVDEWRTQVDGRTYDVWQLDLRWGGVIGYLRTVLASAQSDALAVGPSRAPPPPLRDETRFRTEVRAALRCLRDPVEVARSPLVGSTIVAGRVAGGSGASERARALREWIVETLEGLEATPRGSKWRRAIVATYLEHAAPQERVAERLGIPFRTYRDHLTQGTAELARRMWLRERGLL